MKGARLIHYITGIFLLILLVSSVSLFSAEKTLKTEKPEYTFYKGNTHYENGRYDEAIKEYTRLLDQGLESGSLYYNLGNSFFKKGELGKAILSFERAKRLIPNDSDLRANHRYALSTVHQGESSEEVSMVQRVLNLYERFTIDGLTMLLSLLYIAFVLVLLIRILYPNARRFSLIAIAVVALLLLPGFVSLFYQVSLLEKEAVIVSEHAEAQFEPIEHATTHFTLYEGMKVTIIQSKADWLKVRRPDGKTGWIRSAHAVKI